MKHPCSFFKMEDTNELNPAFLDTAYKHPYSCLLCKHLIYHEYEDGYDCRDRGTTINYPEEIKNFVKEE